MILGSRENRTFFPFLMEAFSNGILALHISKTKMTNATHSHRRLNIKK